MIGRGHGACYLSRRVRKVEGFTEMWWNGSQELYMFIFIFYLLKKTSPVHNGKFLWLLPYQKNNFAYAVLSAISNSQHLFFPFLFLIFGKILNEMWTDWREDEFVICQTSLAFSQPEIWNKIDGCDMSVFHPISSKIGISSRVARLGALSVISLQ